MYGVLERQFRGYFEKAQQSPGTTGTTLLQILERRLDNVVFRLDFAESRDQARQLVRHGHITVGGRKVSVPSYQVRPTEVVGWKARSLERDFGKEMAAAIPRKTVPAWLSLDKETLSGNVLRLPEPNEVDSAIDTRMIVEYYSK